jgi:hypothetical protein
VTRNSHRALTLAARHGGKRDVTLLRLVEEFVGHVAWMPPRDATAVALWAMHMHIFDRFDTTPRLFLTSAGPGCGKTQVLHLLRHLAPLPRPELAVDATPAALYHEVEEGASALLIDEADNLALSAPRHGKLRTILGAFEKGTMIPRHIKKANVHFRPFVPIALGAIGRLPGPLTTRCIRIKMQKKPAGIEKMRASQDDEQFVEIANIVLGHIMGWAETVVLDPKPNLADLNNRFADLWRPLIAIADSFGIGEGDRARKAAMDMIGEYVEQDIGPQLLADIRSVFDGLGVDRACFRNSTSSTAGTIGAAI